MTLDKSCRDFRERLSLYLEGELPVQESEKLTGHVRKCPSCLEEMEILKKTVGVLRDLPPVPPPPEILAEVRKTLYHRPAWKAWLEGWTRPAWVRAAVQAAAVLIVVGSIIFIQQRFPGLDEEARQVSEPRMVPSEPQVVGGERAAPPPEAAERKIDAETAPARPEVEDAAPRPTPAESPGSYEDVTVKEEAASSEGSRMEENERVARDAVLAPPAVKAPTDLPPAAQPAPVQEFPEGAPAPEKIPEAADVPGTEKLEIPPLDEAATRPEVPRATEPPAVTTRMAAPSGDEEAPEVKVIGAAEEPEGAPEAAALSRETSVIEEEALRETGKAPILEAEKPALTVFHGETEEAGDEYEMDVPTAAPHPPLEQAEPQPDEKRERGAEKKKTVLRQDRPPTVDDSLILDGVSPIPGDEWSKGYAPPGKKAAPPVQKVPLEAGQFKKKERRESSFKSMARDYRPSDADHYFFLQAPAEYDYQAHLHREVAGLGGRILSVRSLDEEGASRIAELAGPDAGGKPPTGSTIAVHLPAGKFEKFLLFLSGETPMTTLERRLPAHPTPGDREFLTILIHVRQPA